MTVPTIVCLLPGRRRQRPPQPPHDHARRRRGAGGRDRGAGRALAHRPHPGVGDRRRWRWCTAPARRSSPPPSRRSCPTSCPRPTCRRPTRSTSSCGRSPCGWPARRSAAGSSPPSARGSPSPPTRPRSRPPASPCWRCGPVPRHASPAGLSVMADIRSGPALHPPAHLDLGDARLGRVRLPALPRPDRGAAALRGQEQPARLGRDAGSGVRRRRHRLDRGGGADGPARRSRAAR